MSNPNAKPNDKELVMDYLLATSQSYSLGDPRIAKLLNARRIISEIDQLELPLEVDSTSLEDSL